MCPGPSCQLRVPSLSSPIMLNVLFVCIVLALYLMRSHIFYSSLAFRKGKLPAKPRTVICHHQSSVSVVGTSWMDLVLSIRTTLCGRFIIYSWCQSVGWLDTAVLAGP